MATFEIVVPAEETARSGGEVVPFAAKIEEIASKPTPMEPLLTTSNTERKLPSDIQEALPVTENETGALEAQNVPGSVDETTAISIAVTSSKSLGDTTDMSDSRQPHYLFNPKPIYPGQARRRKQEGLVLLNVLITSRGLPERVDLLQGSGYRILDHAAIASVRHWQFDPARIGNLAMPCRVEVPIRFKLSDSAEAPPKKIND